MTYAVIGVIAIFRSRYKTIAAAVLITLAAIILLGKIFDPESKNVNVFEKITHTLVIDPGHGGIDGGAISASGIKESDINLSISEKMGSICELFGVKYVKTRDSDTDNTNGGKYSEHDNLVARAELANKTENAVLISVHQNTYPSADVRGAEVLYAATRGSKSLGELAQGNFLTALDPNNRRVAIPAPKKLLLTSGVNCPAILAECGFLSNPEEAALLSDNTYQTKIAAILVASFIGFEAMEHPA